LPRIYLDQGGLLKLGGGKPNPQETEVRRRIEAREVALVLSPAHWIDTAGGRSEQKSRELSRFIDGLRPGWLRERVNLHRLEIRCFLDNVPFERVNQMALCNTVTEVVADMGGLVGGGAAIVDTEAMVVRLWRSANARSILQRAYTVAEQANRQNRRMFRAGRFTPELERRLQMLYVRQIANIREGSAEDQQLQQAPPDALRSIGCEWEATKESWRQGGVMTPNRLRDLFHLVVAMPYTDFILTFDRQLRRTISHVRRSANFPTATEVGSMRGLLAALDGTQ